MPAASAYLRKPLTGLFRSEPGLRRDRSGSVAVEAALILPLLCTFLLGIMELGRVMWIQNSLEFAVDAAARCAVINTATCGTSEAIADHAILNMQGINVSPEIFEVTSPACGTQVEATFDYQAATNSLVPLPLTLRARSCRPQAI